ncbi:bifunctional riboflavin kinase/FAD synthetase [Acuticoccus sp. MNP-M23]|uniref:bifunctional riboflavin kinase/FAD synthetase n=1 Tax=Acuticoccus sp. MNP-M23 TaxID=3072793 RepID=UPI0028153498|nr:bifunctional riboflavin kinase/FAD synthetase [Acuticoccus sp. MNP-M23]WMS43865.1 bifunctional riboflavin kinase/FAD synthetase [Acuticoccus sp. MNP-M23]
MDGFAVDLGAVPAALAGGTVAIGNFDGVHRGHQAVLAAALDGPGPVTALTFEPHPRAYFSGAPVFRLTPPAEKARLVKAVGLSALVVARFDAPLAALTADAFIDDVLVGQLGARHVTVGHDFKFGAKRSGDAARLAADPRFGVTVVDAYGDAGGEVVSSSRIRTLLSEGEPGLAATLLGYRYTVTSPIIHGQKRGREMGYPTANQCLPPETALRHGIYAVRIRIDGLWRNGVASFGRRPTFDNGAPLLETHVFDYAGDLYGEELPVTLVSFLRPELTFDGMAPLIAQMNEDSRNARAALAGLTPLSPLDAAINF